MDELSIDIEEEETGREGNDEIEDTASDSDSDDDDDDDDVHHHDDNNDDEDEYIQKVRQWTKLVPIGLGLCPWAIISHNKGRLKYKTCHATKPSEVTSQLVLEIQELLLRQEELHTTLLICPFIESWNNNFNEFDQYVKTVLKTKWYEQNKDDTSSSTDYRDQITLVSFHPQFLRWRGLPNGIKVGSVIYCNTAIGGFQKSQDVYKATILETTTAAFGQRKIKVRYHDNNDDDNHHTRKEQYVSTDWCVFPKASTPSLHGRPSHTCHHINSIDESSFVGPPLPDNSMHRTPHPTIHLIRNTDLGGMRIRDVSRVKRKNAQTMVRLGWDGMTNALVDGK
jgi:hypothetical protein